MKGILHKTEKGWFVIYDQILGEGIVKRNQNTLPLHPLDVKQIDEDSKSFDNIEARIRTYPDVEFEIVEYDGTTPIINGWNGYAKIIDYNETFNNEDKSILGSHPNSHPKKDEVYK